MKSRSMICKRESRQDKKDEEEVYWIRGVRELSKKNERINLTLTYAERKSILSYFKKQPNQKNLKINLLQT
jgi:hypothetical protein